MSGRGFDLIKIGERGGGLEALATSMWDKTMVATMRFDQDGMDKWKETWLKERIDERDAKGGAGV